MSENTEGGADTAWQSIRLIVGAVLLIVGGLGLMLADGTVHPSTALSSVFTAQNMFHQSK